MKMVAILGTGPAGLMAAHACAAMGQPFAIFGLPESDGSVKQSRIGGAQFLNVSVPTVTDDDPDFVLRYEVRGDAETYARKVYGDAPELVSRVSFHNVYDGRQVPAWHMQRIYDRMWNGICGADGHSVNAERVTAQTMLEWMENDVWPLIISTIPRPELCLTHAGLVDRRPHSFTSQTVHILQGEDMGVDYNTICYNGDPDGASWYRSSNIGGVRSTEWGEPGVPPFFKSKVFPIKKPLDHTCDCWKDKPIVFAGRYGKWTKGVLIQDGFIMTARAIEEMRK